MDNTNLKEMLDCSFQWFHAHPELAFEEFETTRKIREILEKEGVAVMETGLETGLVARIDGCRPGPVIGLRCDIDALPVQEETGLSYASEKEGKMHACGHDFHAAVMLGAAILLQRNRERFGGCVKVIFQPAEEVTGGAQKVLETGALADVSHFIGVHTYPQFENGTVGVKCGAVMAAVDRFAVRITGSGAHAAQPQKGIDPIVVQAAVILNAQTIISRNLNPFSKAVLSFTHVEGGTTWNVIPESVFLEGTVRTLDEKDRVLLRERFVQMVRTTAQAYGAKAEIDWRPGPPAVINDADMCRIAREEAIAQGLLVEEQEDTMGGEDFSLYLEGKKGIFIRIGTGGGYPGHHPKFAADRNALYPAACYMQALAVRCLDELDRGLLDQGPGRDF